MSTVGQIKRQIRFYLQQTSALEFEGQDIALDEINAARVNAERMHDFAASLQTSTLSVDPDDGGDLAGITLIGDHRFKSIQNVYLSNSAGDVPIFLRPKEALTMRRRNELATAPWNYATEFRNDTVEEVRLSTAPTAYTVGNTLFLDPKPAAATTVSLDVFTWFPDYTDDNDTDWFTLNGAAYLKWAAVVALNHHTGTFAYRQEGTTPPPEKARDEALAQLFRLDTFNQSQGRVPFE